MKRSPIVRSQTPMKRKASKRKVIPDRIRLKVFERDGYRCQYGDCPNRNLTIDHIVPNGDRIRAGIDHRDADYLVSACSQHNGLKGTRRLVPPSWAPKLAALNERTGREYRVWAGDVREPAFREVHV